MSIHTVHPSFFLNGSLAVHMIINFMSTLKPNLKLSVEFNWSDLSEWSSLISKVEKLLRNAEKCCTQQALNTVQVVPSGTHLSQSQGVCVADSKQHALAPI